MTAVKRFDRGQKLVRRGGELNAEPNGSKGHRPRAHCRVCVGFRACVGWRINPAFIARSNGSLVLYRTECLSSKKGGV